MSSRRELQEVCSHIVDCPHKTAPISNPPYAFAVGTKAIRDGRIDFSKAKPVDQTTYDEWIARLRPEPNDIIFCREAPVGEAVLVPASPRVCLGQRTVLLRADRGLIDPEYLAYALRAPQNQHRLHSLSEGSTVPHLNVSDIRAFSLDLPSKEDQRRTAGVLGALDRRIEANRRTIRTRMELLREIARDRLADAPNVVLGEAFDTTVGGIWGDERETEKSNTKVRVLRGVDIDLIARGNDSDAPVRWVTQAAAAKRLLAPGDVIIEGSGECGRSLCWLSSMDVRYPEPVVFTNFCKRIRPKSGDPATGLLVWLQLLDLKQDGTLDAYRTGTAMPNLDLNALVSSLEVRIPGNDVAEALLDLAQVFLNSGPLLENRTLAALRDAVLPQLISGETKVDETFVPDARGATFAKSTDGAVPQAEEEA